MLYYLRNVTVTNVFAHSQLTLSLMYALNCVVIVSILLCGAYN